MTKFNPLSSDSINNKELQAIRSELDLLESEKTYYSLHKPLIPAPEFAQPDDENENERSQVYQDWLKIIKAYKEQFGEGKIDKNGNMYFAFPSPEACDKFFEQQAQEGKSFMSLEIDGKGPTGNYFFSTGDGMYYKGTVSKDQINEITHALDSWEKSNPEEKKELEKILLKGVSTEQQEQYKQRSLQKQSSDMDNEEGKEDESEEKRRRRSNTL